MLLCLIGSSLYAQRSSFTFIDKETGEANRFEVGDKVLLLYDQAYYKAHLREMTVQTARINNFAQPYSVQGKGRILHITDTSLIFTSGAYMPLKAILRIKKLTLGKQFLRSFGIRTDGIHIRGVEVEIPLEHKKQAQDSVPKFPTIVSSNINKSILPPRLQVGDKVLLAYDYDYYAQNRDKINAYVINPRKPKYGKVLYGKERVLLITDSSLIFTNGTHAHFNSLLAVRKLSFGKRVLRTLGTIAGVYIVVYASVGVIVGVVYTVFIAPAAEAILTAVLSTGAVIGGDALLRNNNNKVKRKHMRLKFEK